MAIHGSVKNRKKIKEISRFANLPSALQLEIRRYLETGDFKSAKVLYDMGVQSSREV
jgi:hypothetical protein